MEFNLTLTQQEINIILQALGEVPLKFSGPVFSKIQQQVQEQEKKPAEDRSATPL